MLRRWLPKIALAGILTGGLGAWASLCFRGTDQWVFLVTRGLWFDNIEELPPRDMAIVPGVLFRNGRPQVLLEERLRLALQLYRSGRVTTILLSGDEEGKGQEVSGMHRWLVERGVPASRLTTDPLGVRTLATMTRAAHVFGVRNAVICTQRVFAPRSLFLARGAGIDAVALVPAPGTGVFLRQKRTERMKIALAFVERYVLGATRSASPNDAATALVALLR